MHTITLASTPVAEILDQTIQILRAGGLVIFPTETTYGAGVDALNQVAVDKLLAYKSRREGKPLSIAVADKAMAEQYVEVNESAARLYQRFLPGPVTVVSKSRGNVARGVESEFGTLGVRIPAYQLILDLVQAYGKPMTATSANGSGARRPYTIADVFAELSEKQKSLIDLVLDAGELPHNPPSTVIDTTLSTPVTFRQGDILADDHQSHDVLTLTSASEIETKNIAKRILLKNWNAIKETGLMIGLNGSLGMGKTVFAKGVAEFLQIPDIITSPTYTYIEEYDFTRHGVSGRFYHLDVWKIENEVEMERLEFEKMLGPRNVILIEWSSNVAGYLEKIRTQYKIPFVEIGFSEENAHRILAIYEKA